MHHGDKRGALVDRLAHRGGVHDSLPVDAHDREPDVRVSLEVTGRVDDRVMLDRGGDQPVALVAPRLERPAQREVVGLGAAAREDDLARLRLDGRRDLVARAVHGRTRGAALGVDARRIAMRFP